MTLFFMWVFIFQGGQVKDFDALPHPFKSVEECRAHLKDLDPILAQRASKDTVIGRACLPIKTDQLT